MLTVLYPVLDALNDGSVIRRYVAGGLQLLAWLTLAAGVLGIVVILKAAFNDALPAEATIAGVAWAIIFATTVWALAQVSLYHARDVRRLRDDRFVVIPVASIILRLLGEQFAVWCAAFGFAGFLIALVAGQYAAFLMNATSMLPGLPIEAGGGLLGALWVLAMSLSTGFAVLLAFYFAGEMVLVAADAANHLRQLVGLAAAPAPMASASATVLPPNQDACSACGTPLAGAGARFCEHCGIPL